MKKETEELNMAEIAAGIAHEIKNPLAVIMANVQLIEMGDTSKEHKKSYDTIYRQIQKANDILLDFIHITRSKPYEFMPLLVYPFLAETVEEMRTWAKSKGVSLLFSSKKEALFIYADKERLKQVIVNLIKNAVEAMECKGEVKISATKEKEEIQIKIQDAGKGLGENKNKIGTPFFTTKEEGTGLGLSLSQRIVKKHHGCLTLEDACPKGCVATVRMKEYIPQ